MTPCPRCHGKGYYMGPWYSDWTPRIVKIACPHPRATRGEILFLAAGLLFIAAMYWRAFQ